MWSPSCGSRRERFASRRVGECVSLMCHCVRHIDVDNKHGRSVKAIHSFLSRWRAGTELCADKQEEPSGKKGSMGSENRQTCSRRFRKSTLRSVPPRFERAARKTRRALAASLRLSCCRGACGKFSLSGRYRRVLKAARSNLGGKKSVTTDFRLPLKLF